MTQIDRYNYETFFLLYADNELTAQDRQAVELFVQQNPDLKIELQEILSARLSKNEVISFKNHFLLKKTGAEIHLDNCENYFILYLDNELNNEQRLMVEKFIEQHKEVESNFNFFKQLKLQSNSSIVLPAKSSLLKNISEITETNYQTFFIQYLDNELNETLQQQVEQFIEQHPKYSVEMELFKQTKLTADSKIEFPNKKLLYKYQTKMVDFGWKRWAAAAAVLLLLGAVFFYFIQNKPDKTFVNKEIIPDNLRNNQTKDISNPNENNNPVIVYTDSNKQKDFVKSNHSNKENNFASKQNKSIETVTNNKAIAYNSINSMSKVDAVESINKTESQIEISETSLTKLNTVQSNYNIKQSSIKTTLSKEASLSNLTLTISNTPLYTSGNAQPDDEIGGENEKSKGGIKGFFRNVKRRLIPKAASSTNTEGKKKTVFGNVLYAVAN